jgi:hypothetical protein
VKNKMMKKFITAAALAATLGSSFLSVAYAEGNNDRKEFLNQVKQARQDLHQQVKQDRQQVHQEVKQDRQDLHDFRKDFRASEAAKMKDKRGKAGHVIDGNISAINGSSFTLTKDGKTFTVNTSSDTKFIRHFWGKSSLAELAVGDKVNVWGTWTDNTKTALDAKLVRNLSVMKRFGVFFGQISSVGSGSFVLNTPTRGDQTVTIGSAKLVNRKEQTISDSDLKVGDKVRVKGVWDKIKKTITEVTQVKDFSLPQNGTGATPTPTASVTATPTP